jgi:hypothetical protein
VHREQSLRAVVERPPFGYRAVRCGEGWELQTDPEQASVIVEIADRILAGDSLTGIASALNEQGIPTPYDWNRQRSGRPARGGHWTIDTLRAVVGPHLDGRYVVDSDGRPVLPAPAILTPVRYEELETELNRRRAAPLQGIVKCACGSWLQLRTVPGRPPQQCDYQCEHLSIPAWWLEGDVTSVALANVGDRLVASTGETFEQAWFVAEAHDRPSGSWARRRALLRTTGLTLSVEEETGDERTRMHGRLGVYRYAVHITEVPPD